jgi:pimeloyl-ACP methyl ester carboxylesterase
VRHVSERVSLAHRRRGSGPPLVLITGTGYPGATWSDDLIGPLTERYTVVTFDHRGTGSTAGTADRYTTRLFAADVVGLLDDLDLADAHVLGHSMGGRVAQWVALDAPERVRTLILAASGPGSFDADRPQTAGIPVAAVLRLVELGYEEYMRAQIRRSFFTEDFAREHPERVEWLVDAFWQHRPGLEDYLKHIAARQEHRTTDRLQEIRQRTLVVIGDRDTHVGGTGSHWDQSQYLATHLPNAELRVIRDAMHGFFWSAPDETVSVLRAWIDGHEAGDTPEAST